MKPEEFDIISDVVDGFLDTGGIISKSEIMGDLLNYKFDVNYEELSVAVRRIIKVKISNAQVIEIVKGKYLKI